MIQAFIFDLDGTIINTEKLKAESYGHAIDELTSGTVSFQQVQKDFFKYVGSPRKTVVSNLVQDYYEQLKSNTSEDDKLILIKMVLEKRLKIYNRLIVDPVVIRQNIFMDVFETIHKLNNLGKPLALATMSENYHTHKILQVTHLKDLFKFVLTSNDVLNGKPNPEIYLKAANMLNTDPVNCLVFEDSLNGIEAALNAGMQVIAIPNELTQKQVIESGIVSKNQLITEHAGLWNKVSELSNLKKQYYGKTKTTTRRN
ncbi:MAG: HAD family phosphatase [Bacteroidales bacterium]|nr:HAD family phosphatase [Bacteroidales bacterium]